MSRLTIRFLGVGNASALSLGASSCVLCIDEQPSLLVDCGPDTLQRFQSFHPGELPPAVFVTHAHLDHIGGLEALFYRAYLDPRQRARVRLYVPVSLVSTLHQRLAGSTMQLAEGGANFWDAFQLVPVGEQFWHDGLLLRAFPVRHHGYMNAFGLTLPGAFLYTGDTKPIPELIHAFASHGETVFHDCGLVENPSHTSLAEVLSVYDAQQRERTVCYHYESEDAAARIEDAGLRVARPGDTFELGNPGLAPTRPRRAIASPTLVSIQG